ncbi:MAG: hypothetical protein II943_00920 [Victivallales bacterium]|nr:hypothetical protein [Victivallales bacterium]
MPSYRHRKALGLEFDTHGARAVLVRRRLNGWSIGDVLHLPWKQEGILSDGEQQRAIREWLTDRHIGAYAACCGLPQADVNTAISDFPPVHNHEQLTRMVEYQTRQLDGLSGEQFLHAFQPLIPLPGQTNPLLISMSRETLLEERLKHFQAMGLRLEQMTSSGLALLNAFEVLQPEAAEQPCLQIVVDFGAETSVLAIYCQGRVQQVSTIALGFAPDSSGDQPLSKAQAFAHEIQGILQSWRSTQRDESDPQPLTQLWLSGTGALNSEVAEVLAADLKTPVHLLGIPARKCAAGMPTGGAIGGVCPALTIAFGLAVQGTGSAPYSLSLIPERLAWQQQKLAACPFLLLSVFILLVAIVIGVFFFSKELRISTERLQIREAELDEALSICPKLDTAYQKIDHCQRKLLPIAETGFRTQRFVDTLEEWLQSLPERANTRETWCFYLADEFSFNQANTPPASAKTARRGREEESSEHPGRQRSSRALENGTSTVRPMETTTSEDNADNAQRSALSEPDTSGPASQEVTITYPPVTQVTQLPCLTQMYIGGFLPSRGNKYQMVKRMQERLNISGTFVNVDDYEDFLSPFFVDSYLSPWKEFLTSHRKELGQEYLFFFLQLPFREAPVKRPAN